MRNACSRFVCGVAAIAVAMGIAACESNKGSPRQQASVEAKPRAVRERIWTNGDFEADALGTPPSGWHIEKYLNSFGVIGTADNPPRTLAALNYQTSSTSKFETFVVGDTSAPVVPQADPDLGPGESFRFPLYGQKSGRVNLLDDTDYGQNKNVNLIWQEYTILPDTGAGNDSPDRDPIDHLVHVRFAVAPVLENPAHPYEQQPYYFILLENETKGAVMYQTFNRAGEAGVPWHNATGVRAPNHYAVQWLDWSLVDIAPGDGVLDPGDLVKLTIVAAGCQPGGHFGRVYVDGLGSTIPGIYVSASALADVPAGAALTYTLSYRNGGADPVTGAVVRMAMPPSTTYASNSLGAACTTATVNGVVVLSCDVGDLDAAGGANDNGSFTVTVTVDNTASGIIINGDYGISAAGSPTLLGNQVFTTVHPPCATNTDCSGNLPICTAANECDACTGDPDCAAKDATRPFCSVPGACVECLTTASCPTDGAPICNQATFTCDKCTTSAECAARDPAKAVCDAGGACHTCPDLTPPTNGTIDGGTTGPFTGDAADQHTFACDTGYSIDGATTLTCNADGTWDNTAPVCTPDPCTDTLTAPDNGSITPVDGTGATGSTITYSCNPAFHLSGGDTVRTCQPDHTWDGTAPTCVQTAGQCTSDDMCDTAHEWCDIATITCTAKIANGGALPVDPSHVTPLIDGDCQDANPDEPTLVCQSGVCDTNDDACGYANGDGPCDDTNVLTVCRSLVCGADGKCGYDVAEGSCDDISGPVVCRSGACSKNGKCKPAFAGGCDDDRDCSASQYCNTNHGLDADNNPVANPYTCVSKLDNGEDIPTIPGHDPTLDHTCTPLVAASVCVSGVCDTTDNKCGFPNGEGPCSSDPLATNVCRSGNCSAAVGGICIPPVGCATDANCDTDHYCDTPTLTCAPKVANGNSVPSVSGHNPILNGQCTSDAGLVACVSGVCDTDDNHCGYADGDGSCDQTSALVVCRSSTCSIHAGVCIPQGGCAVDADCAATEWCDAPTLTCVAKLANGTSIPTETGHTPDLNGTCSSNVGTSICQSGVCDTADNKCGFGDGHGTCSSVTAIDVCRSGVCSSNGACEPSNGCLVDADCTSAQFCNATTRLCTGKVANGTSLPNDNAHSPPLGGACSVDAAAIACASGVCDTSDNLCGHGFGQGPCDASNAATVCRSGVCATDGDRAGTCIDCNSDASCGDATPVCDTSANRCVQCTADAHDSCDASVGQICGANNTCVSGDPAKDPRFAIAGSGLAHGCAATGESGFAVFALLGLMALRRRRR